MLERRKQARLANRCSTSRAVFMVPSRVVIIIVTGLGWRQQ